MTDQVVPSLVASLLERLEGQEALDLEFKSARGGLPRDLWPTVSAFANTRGGWIVLGVSTREGAPAIEGVPHPSDLLQQFTDQVRNRQRISYPVCGPTDTTIERLGEHQVVVLRVRAAPRTSRPVFVGGNPYGGTYVRRHTGDYRCTEPEVDRMMREASPIAADAIILPGYGWSDLDLAAFRGYRQQHLTLNRDSPRNRLDDEPFLESIGGFRFDRETDQRGITLAGLLMFGTEGAILAYRSRHLIDFRILPSDAAADPGVRWVDRVTWEGNLLGAFDTIYPRLVAALPVPFRLAGAVRVDETPLHVSLREGLVNLLVHADYAEPDASLVMRSDREYYYRNPGSSRVLESDFLIGDRSEPRNPALVRMFRFIGLAEEAGTGLPKIIQAWRELGLQMPRIDVGTERYEFLLRLRSAHLLPEEDRQWLAALGDGWTEPEQMALVVARREGEIDNATLRRLTGQHLADTTKTLGSLRDRGFLAMSSWGRGASYRLGSRATAESIAPSADRLGDSITGLPDHDRSMEDNEPSLGGFDPSSGGSGESLGGFGPSSGGSRESSGDSRPSLGDTPSSPGEVDAALQAIAAPIRDQAHRDAATSDRIVLQLCRVAPLTLSELAELLGRNRDHMRGIVRRLIASDRLTYLYPSRRNDPRQRYVAADQPPATPTPEAR